MVLMALSHMFETENHIFTFLILVFLCSNSKEKNKSADFQVRLIPKIKFLLWS